jgi:hypothetical protein
MISFSKEIFKALVLINGGAIVALLGFFGHYTSASTCVVILICCALVAFAIGLALAVSAYVFAYLTQFMLFRESINSFPKVPGGPEGPVGALHMQHFWRAGISVILSLIFFLLGSVLGAITIFIA